MGRTPTEEDSPAVIDADGDVIISKYSLPAVMLALTPVTATVPVSLIVADCAGCVPYLTVVDGNVMLDGLNDHWAAVTVNDSETVLLPPLDVDIVNVPL